MAPTHSRRRSDAAPPTEHDPTQPTLHITLTATPEVTLYECWLYPPDNSPEADADPTYLEAHNDLLLAWKVAEAITPDWAETPYPQRCTVVAHCLAMIQHVCGTYSEVRRLGETGELPPAQCGA